MQRELHEFTQYITPDGEVYHFDSHDKFLLSETGFGMPPIRYITKRSPTQQGETVVDYRLNPRIIQLVHRNNDCSRNDYWQSRANLMSMIRPTRNTSSDFAQGTLRRILPDGTRRDIKVTIEQGPEFVARDPSRWDEWSFTETLRFIAHDPLFYDPDAKSVTLALATTSGLVFPFSLPLLIDDDRINATVACVTSGTEDIYPTITLIGPMSGVVITNESLDNLKIDVNYNISIDETVIIYLEPGNKRIVSDFVGDITNVAYQNSDLSTFRLAAHPRATNGSNTVRFMGSGISSAGPTEITMSWYDKYLGI